MELTAGLLWLLLDAGRRDGGQCLEETVSEFFCVDCNMPRETTLAGNCATCGSKAICLTEPGRIVYDGRLVERLVRAVETVEGK